MSSLYYPQMKIDVQEMLKVHFERYSFTDSCLTTDSPILTSSTVNPTR